MTLELFSTSVPAGLEPGRSGFCTVAMTQGIPRPLADLLESLSAYQHLYAPTDELSANNPVAVSHLRVSAAGRWFTLLSRVCAAGMDYTKRSNRFAHHVVLDGSHDRPAGGPAWLASRPGFLQPAWDGQVRWLEAGRAVPSNGEAVTACPSWRRVAGDPGWAGVAAELMAADRPVYLVYDPGTDVLPLIAEALSLLPPERRWAVTFTTYYRGLPQGVTCQVRGVARGTPEAEAAPANATLDLARLREKPAPETRWAQAARAGQRLTPADMPPPPPEPPPPEPPPRPVQLVMPPAPILTPVGAPAAGTPPPPPFELQPVPPRRGLGLLIGGGAVGLLLCLITVGVGVYAFAFRGGKGTDNGEVAENGPKEDGKENGKSKGDDGKTAVVKNGEKKGKPDDKKNGANPPNGKVVPAPSTPRKNIGRLTLALGEPRLRYGDPIRLRLAAGAGDGRVPLKALVDQLDFTLDGMPVADEVVVHEDGKVELKGKLPAGGYRLAARFGGNDEYAPAESGPVTFHVERNRLGSFTIQPAKKSVRAGEKGLEVELTFDRKPTLDDEDWQRFRFYREGQDQPLKATPIKGRPRWFRLDEPLAPGKARLRATYPQSDRFEEQTAQTKDAIDVRAIEVVFRFPEGSDDPGVNVPSLETLHYSGRATFRVRVKAKDEETNPTPPTGEVHATLDGKRVTPAKLMNGVAELKLDAGELPVKVDYIKENYKRELQLTYVPEGGWHLPLQKNGLKVRVLEERALPHFSTKRSNPGSANYGFQVRKKQVAIRLPVTKHKYYLRLRPPDKKATTPHELYSEPTEAGAGFILRWKHSSPLLDGINDRMVAQFYLVPPVRVGFDDKWAVWGLGWSMVDLSATQLTPDAKKRKELTRLFAEACEEPHLVQACVVEVVQQQSRFRDRHDPVALRFLLSRPPQLIKDPPKSGPGWFDQWSPGSAATRPDRPTPKPKGADDQ